ncbi:MAG: peptidylprolyl isomerase [Candidatus Margulisiibacteriota bacterium]|jgi:parvulin-like peptidyl-prolyl isomerase
MIYFFRKHVRSILIVTLIFFITPLLFYGSYSGFSGGRNKDQQQKPVAENALAVINNEPINPFKYSQLLRQYLNNVQASGEEVDPYTMAALQYQALMQTIEYELTVMKAKAEKVSASGSEVNGQIKAIADANKLSIGDLKKYLKDQGYPFNRFRDDIRNEIAVTKFIRNHEGGIAISDEDLERSLTQLKASHILITDPDDAKALQKAKEMLAQAQAGADFAKLAEQNSADTYSAKKGGDVGWFSAGMMVPEFETAAFTLNPGQIYPEPVKTTYGYHIIKLFDFKKTDLPPNIDATAYRKELLDRKKSQAINDLLKDIRQKSEIKVLSDTHLAYQLQSQGKFDEAVYKYRKLATENPRSYIPYLFIGDLYSRTGKIDDALIAYKQAETIQELNPQTKNSLVNLARGRAYIRQGKQAEENKSAGEKDRNFRLAKEQFLIARDQAKESILIHNELKKAFEEIKASSEAKLEELTVERLKKQKIEEAAAKQK